MNEARRVRIVPLLAACLLLPVSCAHAPPPAVITWNKIAAMPVPPADHRIAYGNDSLQFGELRLPDGPGAHPVVIVIHGGCWRAEYDVKHVGPLSAALTANGIATWTPEYRRIGNDGGGWPGTFEDVARGADFVRELASRYPLDLKRVVTLGHSAGGHLALWLAARKNLPRASVLYSADPLPVSGVVSLAGITDLRAYSAGAGYCNASAVLLMGGAPDSVSDRYAQASPIELLPLGVPVSLVHGSLDKVVPAEQSREFSSRAAARGDQVRFVNVEGAGHFDLISPDAGAWAEVENAVVDLVGRR